MVVLRKWGDKIDLLRVVLAELQPQLCGVCAPRALIYGLFLVARLRVEALIVLGD